MKKVKIGLVSILMLIASGCSSTSSGSSSIATEGEVINLSESGSITINQKGVYTLQGELSNGSVVIETNGDVELILDGVSIHNESGPAIDIISANSVNIVVNEGTTNILSDGEAYVDIEKEGVIYSKADLVISGTGLLEVTGAYSDGIVSKDSLLIQDTEIVVSAIDDGIRGKDELTISNATITVDTGDDALKTSNEEDATLGNLTIESGVFNLTGSKGMNVVNAIVIEAGTFVINAEDDAIHSNNSVEINGGEFTINAVDDAIHADVNLVVNAGDINIESSYEGIEADVIVINGGSIELVSTDDGINAATAGDTSTGGQFMSSGTSTITINGGETIVHAGGDGVDANGSILMTEGSLFVYGPTDGANGSLDYDSTFNVDGGEFFAAGSSMMAMSASTTSAQNFLSIGLSQSYSAQSTIQILVDGAEVLSTTATTDFQLVQFSSDGVKTGSSYQVLINDEEVATGTISEGVTQVGSAPSGMGGGMGGNGGGMGDRGTMDPSQTPPTDMQQPQQP
ncbi:MAG: carbohydrate-binding domain-containing protein [Anaerorhabdus sp.]